MSFQGNLRRSRRRLAAFTLIEMMISLVITLGMVYAMVEVFARIGKQTTESRAVIEMLGQIRSARYRLEQDLKGITVPLQPWVDADASPGYFELIEGAGRDIVQFVNLGTRPANSNPTIMPSRVSSLQPVMRYIAYNGGTGARSVALTAIDVTNTTAARAVTNESNFDFLTTLGDVDDVICFTARSNGEPFRGTFLGETIESNLAEIIWWTELNDTNGNNQWDYDRRETFRVHRRVLLIRPDLNNSNQFCYTASAFASGTQYQYATKEAFLAENDLSVHEVYNGSGNYQGLSANSLTDLSYHKNRVTRSGFTTNGLIGTSPNLRTPTFDVSKIPTFYPNTDRFGEDVILANVLAFDFRVFDPNAPLIYNSSRSNPQTTPDPDEALLDPGDPGYLPLYSTSIAGINSEVARRGAFVDLGALEARDITAATVFNYSSSDSEVTSYKTDANNVRTSAINSYNSHFLGPRDYRSRLDFNLTAAIPASANELARIYDTWPLQYEKDGNDQDNDSLTDEAANGLDDDNQNGVDDPGERETSPPYPHPLRGLQVKIRMLEADTRQVRQSSFAISFVQD